MTKTAEYVVSREPGAGGRGEVKEREGTDGRGRRVGVGNEVWQRERKIDPVLTTEKPQGLRRALTAIERPVRSASKDNDHCIDQA